MIVNAALGGTRGTRARAKPEKASTTASKVGRIIRDRVELVSRRVRTMKGEGSLDAKANVVATINTSLCWLAEHVHFLVRTC